MSDAKEKNVQEEAQEEAESGEQTANKEQSEQGEATFVSEDYKEQFVRVTADFQNYKRRIEKERLRWMQEAQADAVREFLPVVDDLERAISSQENGAVEGLQLIQKNLQKVFKKLSIKEIDCSGPFNPEHHEAIMQVDSEKHQQGDVVAVVSKGYLLHGLVLRHAKVSVAK